MPAPTVPELRSAEFRYTCGQRLLADYAERCEVLLFAKAGLCTFCYPKLPKTIRKAEIAGCLRRRPLSGRSHTHAERHPAPGASGAAAPQSAIFAVRSSECCRRSQDFFDHRATSRCRKGFITPLMAASTPGRIPESSCDRLGNRIGRLRPFVRLRNRNLIIFATFGSGKTRKAPGTTNSRGFLYMARSECSVSSQSSECGKTLTVARAQCQPHDHANAA